MRVVRIAANGGTGQYAPTPRAMRAALAGLVIAGGLLWPPATVAQDGGGRVAAVIDGETLSLVDGRVLRIAGIEAPRPPLGSADRPWRAAAAARAGLAALALDRIVVPRAGRPDRYGRRVAQLERDDGVWLAGALLRQGLVRVHSQAEDRERVAEMLAIERAARKAGRGIWRDPYYRIRRAAEAARFIESFQLVEGRIVEAGRVKGQILLAIGATGRTDLVLRLPRAAQALFADAGLDPLSLDGERVRVRGWLRLELRRLVIEISHPEQIERLRGR